MKEIGPRREGRVSSTPLDLSLINLSTVVMKTAQRETVKGSAR